MKDISMVPVMNWSLSITAADNQAFVPVIENVEERDNFLL